MRAEMRKMGKASFLTALGGVILPFIGGTGISMYFGLGLLESLFIGAILTATSVSIRRARCRKWANCKRASGP